MTPLTPPALGDTVCRINKPNKEGLLIMYGNPEGETAGKGLVSWGRNSTWVPLDKLRVST